VNRFLFKSFLLTYFSVSPNSWHYFRGAGHSPLSYLSHGGERRFSLTGKERNIKTLLTSLYQREGPVLPTFLKYPDAAVIALAEGVRSKIRALRNHMLETPNIRTLRAKLDDVLALFNLLHSFFRFL